MHYCGTNQEKLSAAMEELYVNFPCCAKLLMLLVVISIIPVELLKLLCNFVIFTLLDC